MPLSNAWQVQAPPRDSNGIRDCCCGGPPGPQQALCSLCQLPRSSQPPSSFVTSSLEVTGCRNGCLEAKGSIDGSSISGSHPGHSGVWPAPAPLPLSLLKSPGKSKGWRESSIHSWCLFKALIPAQMTPVLCVPTAPSCPEQTKPRGTAEASRAHFRHCN